MRRIVHATNCPCDELSGDELSATNCPATNCPATNCPPFSFNSVYCNQNISDVVILSRIRILHIRIIQ